MKVSLNDTCFGNLNKNVHAFTILLVLLLCNFSIALSLEGSLAGICQGTLEIVSKEVLLSVRGSYQTI